MTEGRSSNIVGAVVAWPDVPDCALVLTKRADGGLTNYYIRRGDRGWWVGGNGKVNLPATFINVPPLGFAWPIWNAWRDAGDVATIVALDLAGDETATALRRLAETWHATQAQAQEL